MCWGSHEAVDRLFDHMATQTLLTIVEDLSAQVSSSDLARVTVIRALESWNEPLRFLPQVCPEPLRFDGEACPDAKLGMVT